MALYIDWPSENAHRAFPFDPIDSDNNPTTNNVPDALILDLRLIATDSVPDNTSLESSTYISKIVTDGMQIRFYMSIITAGSDTPVDCGCIATVDVSDAIKVVTNVSYAGNGFIFEGKLITGDTTVVRTMPPVIELNRYNGRLNEICIQHMTYWVAGLQVGDKTYGGLVNLEAGPGVTITANGNTLTISCSGAIPPDNTTIIDDQTLLNEVTTLYGTPITKINHTACGGDWTISVKASEGLVVTPDANTTSIIIENTKAQACCTIDDIETLVTNIGALNERVGVIQSVQTQLDGNLNILSAQLARLM